MFLLFSVLVTVKAVPHKYVNASKITTFESVFLLFNISKDANSVDPDQTAPIGAV